MERKNLLSAQDYPAACMHCLFGKPAPEGTTVLCKKKGVMLGSSACKKYRYDPLKRVPKRQPELPHYDAQEFRI